MAETRKRRLISCQKTLLTRSEKSPILLPQRDGKTNREARLWQRHDAANHTSAIRENRRYYPKESCARGSCIWSVTITSLRTTSGSAGMDAGNRRLATGHD